MMFRLAARLFLSTLSLRRATIMFVNLRVVDGFLSTLSLRRATFFGFMAKLLSIISIHALLAESDEHFRRSLPSVARFLSTLSLRRATPDGSSGRQEEKISIHALLAESDHFDNFNLHCVEISIHALLAESDYILTISICTVSRFLSTLSLRRATH